MCHNLKKLKGYEEKFSTNVDLCLLKMCAKFLEKVTKRVKRNKKVKDKKS